MQEIYILKILVNVRFLDRNLNYLNKFVDFTFGLLSIFIGDKCWVVFLLGFKLRQHCNCHMATFSAFTSRGRQQVPPCALI